MGELFGTDGVRGVANVAPMTAELVLELGRAAAYVCRRHAEGRRARVVIGKDTRVSGYMIESALTAGICSMGVDVYLLGPMPTPGIAFITRDMRADAGLVISASHNPYQDNGIKVFSRDGFKLPDDDEKEIEDLIRTGLIRDIRPTAGEVGKARRIEDAAGRYIVFCKKTFPDPLTLDGLRVVLDCAHGATYRIAPVIFSELGATVHAINCSPDGLNINRDCGSQHPEGLAAAVRTRGADAGLAFDGDGDRLIAVDETGTVLTGDHILAICARMYKQQGRLRNNLVVSTVMSNFGFLAAMKKLAIEHGAASVGDRCVLEMMRRRDAVVGGEASGHILFLNHHTTGDGIVAALQLLAALRESGQPLSELSRVMDFLPQALINVDVARRPPLDEVPEVRDAIRAAEAELGDSGRVLVRYSGTQSVCRVMVEGPTVAQTDAICRRVAAAVRRCLN